MLVMLCPNWGIFIWEKTLQWRGERTMDELLYGGLQPCLLKNLKYNGFSKIIVIIAQN